MKTIYYVENDADIAYSVCNYLQRKGFGVTIAHSAAKARGMLEKQLPYLCLVDWNLPDESGESLCRWIKQRWEDLPIIFLTVRADTRDIVQGFHAGADDYITKPFDLEVLYSRICALLRRVGNTHQTYLTCGPISLDKAKRQAYFGGQALGLSAMEYCLLATLLENKNRTVTRQMLLETIWDVNGNFVNDNTLTVTIKRLREKLGNPFYLKTIRSFGYRMEDV